MNMKQYVTDTNILIYYLNGSLPIEIKEKTERILEMSFNISVITKIEFLGWRKHTEESFKKAKQFLSHARVLGMTNKIADCAINLRRIANLKTPDALIAATAIQHKAILVTRNSEDFKNIRQVYIFNPFDKLKAEKIDDKSDSQNSANEKE